MEYNIDDLVSAREGNKVFFIGRVIEKCDILTQKNLSFLRRYHESKSVYKVRGWNDEGIEETQSFFDEQLDPAFKLDFDRLILNLTKKKLMIDSTIQHLEVLQNRALEARRNRQ